MPSHRARRRSAASSAVFPLAAFRRFLCSRLTVGSRCLHLAITAAVDRRPAKGPRAGVYVRHLTEAKSSTSLVKDFLRSHAVTPAPLAPPASGGRSALFGRASNRNRPRRSGVRRAPPFSGVARVRVQQRRNLFWICRQAPVQNTPPAARHNLPECRESLPAALGPDLALGRAVAPSRAIHTQWSQFKCWAANSDALAGERGPDQSIHLSTGKQLNCNCRRAVLSRLACLPANQPGRGKTKQPLQLRTCFSFARKMSVAS